MDDKDWMRGYWIILHLLAEFVDKNTAKGPSFIAIIIYVGNNFPCETCRPHFINYITKNKPDEQKSYSYYFWEFHNAVNSRLGKKLYSFDEYKKNINNLNIANTWLAGMWIFFHSLSWFVDAFPKYNDFFVDFLRYLYIYFPSIECKSNYTKYIDNNPPEIALSYFEYTWDFHNYINIILDKPKMSADTYKIIYTNEGYKCETCGSNGKNTSDKIISKELIF